MNSRERGLLLLTTQLGVAERRVLTQPQLLTLRQRLQAADLPLAEGVLSEQTLRSLGYDREQAARIAGLLQEGDLLDYYLSKGKALGCRPITLASPDYPPQLPSRLGQDAPCCFWVRGELPALPQGGIALVGSRELHPRNRAFAQAVGRLAAQQGLPLISGNARGADRAAQEACLASGGQVISVVADRLSDAHPGEKLVYLSENGYDEAFSAHRALRRNRVIHALGRLVFVAQCALHRGGTWDGTARNLRFGWSTVACFRDGSEASRALEQQGAFLVGMEELEQFGVPSSGSLFDRETV